MVSPIITKELLEAKWIVWLYLDYEGWWPYPCADKSGVKKFLDRNKSDPMFVTRGGVDVEGT